MERGAQALIKVLGAALLFGVLVLVIHPSYRAAIRATWRGQMEQSPVWESNRTYYPMVTLEAGATDAATK